MIFDPTDSSLPVFECPTDGARVPGNLEVERDGKRVALPLGAISVLARVSCGVASVTVSQTYQNPFAEPLEAVYIFPLAGGSAVQDFSLRVGDRVIRGAVKERGEARQDYIQAVEEGRRAALLEQERDDVFTVQLGNLPPGEEATVVITYSEMLDSTDDGVVELRLPFVVAPRYIPGDPLSNMSVGDGVESDTDVVRDASRITPPRLAPGFDPSVSLALEVVIDAAGLTLSDLVCTQHATRTDIGNGAVRIGLSRSDERLNRDFVLRWREEVEGAVGARYLVSASATGETYGMLSLDAPMSGERTASLRDVVFVVDRSGSMGGDKMASASRACAMLLDGLVPSDRFAILAFDDHIEWFANASIPGTNRFSPADRANRDRGARYLRSIESRGGTEIDGALDAAISALGARDTSSEGRASVIVLLTDGQVGDESRILKSVQQRLGKTRLFTIGIDTAVNDGLLKRMANLGRGTASFVEPGAELDRALVSISREIGQPVVTDVTVTAENGEEVRLAPEIAPDLFAGRRANVFLATGATSRLHVRGLLAGGGEIDMWLDPTPVELPAIAHLWGRARVTDLEDRFRMEPSRQDELKREIIDVSVRHRILSRFTAFVVVDEHEVVVTDGALRHVVQPVEMPALWGAPAASMSMPRGVDALYCRMPIPQASRVMFDLGDSSRAPIEQSLPAEPERGALGELRSRVKRVLGGRRAKSVDECLGELRKTLDAIQEVIEGGDTPSHDEIEGVLAKLRKAMPKGDVYLSRIVDALEQLIAVLKAAGDPTDALKAVEVALGGTDNFWESSI